jgi:hypothetical protein
MRLGSLCWMVLDYSKQSACACEVYPSSCVFITNFIYACYHFRQMSYSSVLKMEAVGYSKPLGTHENVRRVITQKFYHDYHLNAV